MAAALDSFNMTLVIAALSLAIWVYLVAFHGQFWRMSKFDDLVLPTSVVGWPPVVVVTPARDEADNIAACVTSILKQKYPGQLSMVLVDDQSSDGTAGVAHQAAVALGASDRLTVLPGTPLPRGWTGKLWAVKQGVTRAEAITPAPTYVLLTDADIVYDDDIVLRLVARARSDNLVMVSVMANLRCESLAERLLIPAFIFFFAMLYPFSWVNRRDCATAAAAGGCVLVRRDALREAGGIDAIRGALIDDCALAKRLKSVGPVWLGFAKGVRSIRASERIDEVGRMISRSAYAQLRYSPWMLIGMIVAMSVVFVAPVVIAVGGDGLSRILALLAWAAMALAFQPTLRAYGRSPLWGAALPGIALAYMAFTINSAYQHVRGRGGMWKGRVQANVSGSR